jgi:acid stress-induced BolA-like protein IbaG/YrbA
MVTAEDIRKLIETALPQAEVQVRGDDGRHFEAEVTWEGFRGLRLVAQHQRVYEALGGRMGTEIHALQLVTRTP